MWAGLGVGVARREPITAISTTRTSICRSGTTGPKHLNGVIFSHVLGCHMQQTSTVKFVVYCSMTKKKQTTSEYLQVFFN